MAQRANSPRDRPGAIASIRQTFGRLESRVSGCGLRVAAEDWDFG